MRRTGTLALMLVALGSAAAAAPGDRDRARREREAREHPEFYSCGFMREVAGGQLSIGAQLDLDGHPISYNFRWDGGTAGEGLSATYDWGGTSYGPVEWWHARFTIATRQHLGFATLVLRDTNGRLIYEPRFGGSNGGRSPGSGLRYYSLEMSAEMFAETLRTPGGVMLELRGRRTLPPVPIDLAPVATIQAALAADRGELERRIADYRNRCEPGRNEDIIVT
jgi:hypothetical protein